MTDDTPGPAHPRPASVPDPARLRREYESAGLDEQQLAGDWPTQFGNWLAEAITAGVPEPNAMTLATADSAGRPSARTVLLKGYDEHGFVCYTNLRSRKAVEALVNPYASLVFCWLPLHRQVVVCGTVTEVSREETEAYFAHRPRGAQLGAWASPQSEAVTSRAELDEGYAEVAARFPGTAPVPVPPHWGGLRVVPESVEFWQGRPDRLHDRLRFRRVVASEQSSARSRDRPARAADSGDAGVSGEIWTVERLAP